MAVMCHVQLCSFDVNPVIVLISACLARECSRHFSKEDRRSTTSSTPLADDRDVVAPAKLTNFSNIAFVCRSNFSHH
jgi:hypothetical protein